MLAAPMLSDRVDLAVALVNDQIYAIEGTTNYTSAFQVDVATNEQYTPIGYGTIPEFPTWIILFLFMIATLITITIAATIRKRAFRGVFNKTKIHFSVFS
jgi:hypothetical protein